MAKTKKKIKTGADSFLRAESGLTLNQEYFCQLYASDQEFFANGTHSYIKAFAVDVTKPNYYKVAQSSASRLLSSVIICQRINELLELRGLNDQFVDKQLEFLITQNADFKTKATAIKEYNKLKKRVDDKANLNVNLYSLKELFEKSK